VAGLAGDFRIECRRPEWDGDVYHPAPPGTGVLSASLFSTGGGVLTACPSATPIGLALGPD
jgi:hypothetical protein